MATNLDLDPDLIERAVALSGAPTRRAAVMAALQEFVARRKQGRLLELFGKLEWDPAYPKTLEAQRLLQHDGDTLCGATSAQRVEGRIYIGTMAETRLGVWSED